MRCVFFVVAAAAAVVVVVGPRAGGGLPQRQPASGPATGAPGPHEGVEEAVLHLPQLGLHGLGEVHVLQPHPVRPLVHLRDGQVPARPRPSHLGMKSRQAR